MPGKYYSHFYSSDVTVTLNADEDHQNWYKSVMVKGKLTQFVRKQPSQNTICPRRSVFLRHVEDTKIKNNIDFVLKMTIWSYFRCIVRVSSATVTRTQC